MNFPWDKEPGVIYIGEKELDYEVKSYPDGTKYVVINKYNSLTLTYRINSYDDLWILGQINDILKRNRKYVSLTIPNLLDAQADRRFEKNQPHSLKLVCNYLNNLTNFCEIRVFHPHNPEVVEALIDNVKIIDNFEFIDRILQYKIADKTKQSDQWGKDIQDNLILMSSDAGGFKPLMKLCDKLKWSGETYSASKSRKYEDGHSKLIQIVDRTDFEGKDILIIDDLSIGGGTFKGLAKLLRDRNCGKLYLAVSHMTILNLGEDPVTNYFDKVFTTNSKFKSDKYYGNYYPGSERTVYPKNLEVMELWK